MRKGNKYRIKCEVCLQAFSTSWVQTKTCSIECAQDRYKKRYKRHSSYDGVATGTVGAVSEMEIAAFLMKLGFSVFRALSPACFCDLIAIKNGKTLNIECRTGYRSTTNYVAFPNATHGGITCFAVYVPTEDKVFFFGLNGKTEITLEALLKQN